MMTRAIRWFVILIISALIQSCSSATHQDSAPVSVTITPTFIVSDTSAALSLPQNDNNIVGTETMLFLPELSGDASSLPSDFWMGLPVIPESVSERAREIYARGMLMGNNPNAFSKVGDCHSTNPYFLADYDLGPSIYNLGEYADLQLTIDYFLGSFGRSSLAVKQGLSTAGALATLWSDWKQCETNETPLDCEFRLNRPSIALISLGTNEAYDVKLDKTHFEGRLRRIIEHSIDQGVVPILSTKADNDEGDNYINYVTAKLAIEYELPLWNFWRAVQPISQHGMRSVDHLTFAPTSSFTDFSRREYLDYGMQMRNLTALQVLDMIRREINHPQAKATAARTLQTKPELSIDLQAGATLTSPADGMSLAYIPAGEFIMGSNSGNMDELPVHMVSLASYWMDATEVTNSMFANFLNEAGNRTEGGIEWLDLNIPLVWVSNKSGVWQPLSGKDDYPIVGISWYGANAYCEWAGRALPTEAQWEYAAKGMDGSRFPWGDKGPTCNRSHFLGCGNMPIEVGSLPLGVSLFGIYEMAGNVSEWVSDRYEADYYQKSPLENPTGPTNGYYRVFRGGSWGSSYIGLQTAHRDWAGADTRYSDIGFRCVLNP